MLVLVKPPDTQYPSNAFVISASQWFPPSLRNAGNGHALHHDEALLSKKLD